MKLALVRMRMNRGLSRAAAARSIGIARGTLVSAECGHRIGEAQAKRIADFYDVRVTDIWPVDDPGAA